MEALEREKQINKQLMQRKEETEWQLMEALSQVGTKPPSPSPSASIVKPMPDCRCCQSLSWTIIVNRDYAQKNAQIANPISNELQTSFYYAPCTQHQAWADSLFSA